MSSEIKVFCSLISCLLDVVGLRGFESASIIEENHNNVNVWIFTFDKVVKNKVPSVYVTRFQATPGLLDAGSRQGRNDRAVLAPQTTMSHTLIHVISQRILNKRIADDTFANTIREHTSICMSIHHLFATRGTNYRLG